MSEKESELEKNVSDKKNRTPSWNVQAETNEDISSLDKKRTKQRKW